MFRKSTNAVTANAIPKGRGEKPADSMTNNYSGEAKSYSPHLSVRYEAPKL